MNSTVDKEMIEEENDIEVAENEIQPQYFDSLNRTDFVKNVIQIIENLSAQKASKCYAIKGTWGVGKTHVLDMIEKELFNEYRQADAYDKYIIFHYNAWEYDYYEEPLFAMVTSMYTALNKEYNLLSDALIEKIKDMFSGILDIADTVGKAHGMDWISWLIPKRKSISKEVEAQILDSNNQTNKRMKKLKEGLKECSSKTTIIVVVDELDRCLPEYAIKVLERLHHIFNDMENTQVILSVDYDQLENTVKTIFGENTSTKRYLSKFINFSINLDEGCLGGNFDTAFSEYVEQFEYSKKYSYIVDSEHVEQFKDFIFKGIEMRRSIEIINRSQLIHTLLNSGSEKMDISYMCVEIVLTFWKSIIDNGETTFSHPHCFSNGVSHSNSNNHPCVGIPKGLQALEDIYETADRISDGKWTRGYCFKESGKSCISVFDIWGIILISMAEISGHSCISLSNGHFQDDYLDYVAEYWKMLQIIN